LLPSTPRRANRTGEPNQAPRRSLLSAIDRTVTGAGARELASRLSSPLTDAAAINARLDAVSYLASEPRLRQTLREELKSAPDLARALARLALTRGGPRDLGAVRDAIPGPGLHISPVPLARPAARAHASQRGSNRC
jgi:DNA mismatch repair ATPase MutS